MRVRCVSAALAVVAVLLVSSRSAAQPDGPDIALTAEQGAKLAAAGWPPLLPEARTDTQDFVQRRGGAPVLGELVSLHAFATIAKPTGETRVPRNEIGFILLDGNPIPAGLPLLPLDDDSVVLVDGVTVLAGHVETQGDAIYVAGRTLRQRDAAFIHLVDPAIEEQEAQVRRGNDGEAATGGTGSDSSGNAGAGRATPAAGDGSRPSGGTSPVGPGEIPWGEAVWRGNVRFEAVTSTVGDEVTTTESGNYAITFKESLIGTKELLGGVTFAIEFLAYRYTRTRNGPVGQCPAFSINAQGVGFDGVAADLQSMGTMRLPIGEFPNDAGGYLFVIMPPAYSDAADCDEAFTYTDGHPLLPLSLSSAPGNVDAGGICESTAPLAPPPYTTIDGENVCGTPGEYGYHTVSWHFDRGVPGADPTMDQDPCATPRALRDLAATKREAALEALEQIRMEFNALAQQEAAQRRTKDQLEWAFNLMLAASISADLGKKLLELAMSEGALKAAAASGRITAAQQQFIGRLNDAIELFQQWQEFADDPGEWGKSKMFGGLTELEEAGEGDEEGESFDYADSVMQMAAYGQLLGDIVGLNDDRSATLEYIEDNLSSFGPLIPEYSLNKARQYVEVSQMWADTIRQMSDLVGESTQLAYQIEELGLDIAVRDGEMTDCE